MHNSKLKLEIEELTRTMTIQDIINDSIKDMPDVPQKLLEDIWKNIQDSIARLDDALLGTNVIFSSQSTNDLSSLLHQFQ